MFGAFWPSRCILGGRASGDKKLGQDGIRRDARPSHPHRFVGEEEK